MSEANRERVGDDGLKIIAVVGEGVRLVQEYERARFSEPMLQFITRRFAPRLPLTFTIPLPPIPKTDKVTRESFA